MWSRRICGVTVNDLESAPSELEATAAAAAEDEADAASADDPAAAAASESVSISRSFLAFLDCGFDGVAVSEDVGGIDPSAESPSSSSAMRSKSTGPLLLCCANASTWSK